METYYYQPVDANNSYASNQCYEIGNSMNIAQPILYTNEYYQGIPQQNESITMEMDMTNQNDDIQNELVIQLLILIFGFFFPPLFFISCRYTKSDNFFYNLFAFINIIIGTAVVILYTILITWIFVLNIS